MSARYGMLARRTRGIGLAAVGMALIVSQGCRKQSAPAPVQPVVRSAPRAKPPVFTDVPLPPQPVVADQAVHHSARRVAPVAAAAPRPAVDPAALAAAQRQQDAVLLQQQQAASQRQQQELNGVVERSAKIRQAQQDEPRIQEAPEAPIDRPLPGMPNQRIQDNPGAPPPQQAEPEQPATPEGDSPDGANPQPLPPQR